MDPLAWTQAQHRDSRPASARGVCRRRTSRLVATAARAPDDAAAERRPGHGGWSAAQIGWHVAAVTTRFAGLISGDVPGAQPCAGFCRAAVGRRSSRPFPSGCEAPAIVAAAAGGHAHDAIAALEASGMSDGSALDSVDPGARRVARDQRDPWSAPSISIRSVSGRPPTSSVTTSRRSTRWVGNGAARSRQRRDRS